MKPGPTEAIPTPGARVEFAIRFTTGPKGARRMKAAGEAAPPSKIHATTAVSQRPAAPVVSASVAPRQEAKPAPPVVARPHTTAPRAAVPEQPDTSAATAAPRVPKIALLLVLGHHFEWLVRSGAVRDYAKVARRTGLTRARITQVVNLTLLAPEIQELILDPANNAKVPVERHLRRLEGVTTWEEHRRALKVSRK